MMASESSKRLSSSITISNCPSEIFCAQFSPNDEFLAAGCGDGSIKVFNSSNGKLLYSLNDPETRNGLDLPCTSIRFRPATSSAKTKNVLLSANSDGSLQHWHVTSGKCINTIVEQDNQFFCLDYNTDGSLFAAAGKDHAIYVYDEQTKKQTVRMQGGAGTMLSGHSNRIFSLKFHPKDQQLIASGGWDNTVHIWDLRCGKSIRSFYGPHIAGDALDIDDNNQILTGSWRADEPLELWEFDTGKKISTIPWDQSHIQGPSCFLYVACYSPDFSLIAAAGSGSNKVKVFDHKKQNKLVGTIAGIQRGVFTLSFSSKGDRLAIGGADSSLRIIDVKDFDPASSEFLMSPKSAQHVVETTREEFGVPKKSETIFPPSPIKLA